MKKVGGFILGVLITAAVTGATLVLLRHIGPAQRITGLVPPGNWQLFRMREEDAA